MIHILDFLPAMDEAQSLCLLFEVGILSAGHFVYVNLGVGEVFGSVGCLVVGAHGFPITGQLVHSIYIKTRLARMAAESVVQAAAAGLGGTVAHSAHSSIYDINAGINCTCVGVDSVAAALVGVQMDRYVDIGFEAAYQAVSCFRLQQAGHILDGDDVGTGFFQLLSHIDVVM